MTDMIVSNGWENGVFFYAGIVDGKPEYCSANNWIIYWGDPAAWYYANYDGDTYDISQDDVATPDLATWGIITVTAASSGQNLTLTCAAGSYSLTGTNVTLTHTPASQNLTLACNAGSYSLTGTNADLTVKRNYVLACSAGSYSLTGTNADLTVKRNYVLACGAGNYALTGADIEMLVTYILLGSVAILPNLFALGAKGKRVSIRPTNGRIKL